MLIRCAGQLRPAPHGAAVSGLDLAAVISLAMALGYEIRAVAELLPAAEAGLVAALNARLEPSN